jgi:dTDP-4-amino-4,6-dideoxygalactose transaminase
MSGVKVLSSPDDPDYQSSFWLFTILVERKLEFISYMKEQGIMVSQVHQRNDVHTCFKDFRVELPNLNEVEKKIVCIPVGWWIERSDLERMVEAIGDFV